MGKLSSVRSINETKVAVSLEISPRELSWLKGNVENLHLFSESNLQYDSRVVQRGKKDSSKYFLMPKELRKELIVNGPIKCNRIETPSKDIYIFALDKYKSLSISLPQSS